MVERLDRACVEGALKRVVDRNEIDFSEQIASLGDPEADFHGSTDFS
jgi:hypothetical protein